MPRKILMLSLLATVFSGALAAQVEQLPWTVDVPAGWRFEDENRRRLLPPAKRLPDGAICELRITRASTLPQAGSEAEHAWSHDVIGVMDSVLRSALGDKNLTVRWSSKVETLTRGAGAAERLLTITGRKNSPAGAEFIHGECRRVGDLRAILMWTSGPAEEGRRALYSLRLGAPTAKRSGFERADAPKASFVPPAGWKESKSSSRMRLKLWSLPGSEDATCVVYFFGAGGGGGIAANVERWVGQFDGATEPRQLKIDVAEGISATMVEATGTYVAETRPGSGERVNKPQWALLAAIVDMPGGPLYVKAVGPKATITDHRDSFYAWINSFRAAK